MDYKLIALPAGARVWHADRTPSKNFTPALALRMYEDDETQVLTLDGWITLDSDHRLTATAGCSCS